MFETQKAAERGDRTWFGTLTFGPEAQQAILDDARAEWLEANAEGTDVPEWWDDFEYVTYYCRKRKRDVTVKSYKCDERFAMLRTQTLKHLARYWARLRKKHKFRYLAVVERHITGFPHVHFLMHECEGPIRKRELVQHWVHGFVDVSIVGGKSSRAASPDKAAWYVCKYLSKSVQSRQMASQGYRPPERSNRSGKRSQSQVTRSRT